jgi:cation diffusion facilitator CzcD-associated flavoprotein CzcO
MMHPSNQADAPISVNEPLDVLVIGGGQPGLAVGDRRTPEG